MAKTKPKQDPELIKEVRENFQYCVDSWHDIREEAKVDMRFIAGDSWDPAERARREDPKQPRPCISLDELCQFSNSLINDIREMPRSIKVIPTGAGANDKTAELRGNKIRNIEYESNAQAAYTTAFENSVQRSYGYVRISTAYISPGNPFRKEKKIVIRRLANPDTAYPDPDFREADGSDMGYLFVIDQWPWKKYTKEFPDAQILDFSADRVLPDTAGKWMSKKHVQVAEYWRVEKETVQIALLPDGTTVDLDKVPEGISPDDTGEMTRNKVTQYLTNGMEILEENPWPGKYIPIIMWMGKELWIQDDAGSKRKLESLIRHARDPQQLLNYYASAEAEVVRMVPKTPFLGARGQFTNPEVWQKVNDTPVAFLEYEAFLSDAPSPNQPLPPPARPVYDPPVQQLELGKESARRSVQSAMGIQPLPTAAQQLNQKSGIALERIKDETQKGSFHFVDNHERALMHCGRVINDLLKKVIDTPRDEMITKKDGTHHLIKMGEPMNGSDGQPMTGKDGQPILNDFGSEEHEITISTGPSYQSEREQANQFVESLFVTIPNLPISDAAKAQLVSLAIKLKDIGPIGDEMVEVIFPSQQAQIPPQAQGIIKQLQQRLQMSDATVAQLMQEKVTQMAKLTSQERMADAKNETAIAIAEIETKAQLLSERVAAIEQARAEMHDAAHDVGMSEMEHRQQLAQQQNAAQLTPPPAAEGQSAGETQAQGNSATPGA